MKALIFDVDGTLAETEELHRLAFNRSFEAAGLGWHWSLADYKALLRTTGGKERMKAWGGRIGSELDDGMIAAVHADKTRRFGALMAEAALPLRPGIAALMAHARAKGLRMAVATTTSRPNVEALCRACFGAPAQSVFEVIAAGDEVPAKKPAPDVYRLALQRLALKPEDAVALEDSRNGVLAAKAAGLTVIAAPSLYTADDRLDAADLVADVLSVALLEALGPARL